MGKGFHKQIGHRLALLALVMAMAGGSMAANERGTSGYDQLLELFADWREFERPPVREGAPDYTKETFDTRYAEFQSFQDRLNAIDSIPISLGRWEMTELDDEILDLTR